MPVIKLTTIINAPIERCFDLSRSIDLHKISTSKTREEAIGGETSGLIGMGESVTWRARHFGIFMSLTSRITTLDYPSSFTDEMISGPFKFMKHHHGFSEKGSGLIMTDTFEYKSPFGFFGVLADRLFLKAYMTKLLTHRNMVIREYAESTQWKELL